MARTHDERHTAERGALAARFPAHMNASDAVMWDIEKDPVLRSTVTAVAILDAAPDWDQFVARMDRVSCAIPRLRQRVVVPFLRIGPPQWVVDGSFDLGYHLRRVEVPRPGTLADVLALVEPLAAAPFDRARPLWEFTIVEGLEGGRAALVQKLHHSLTDGVGGVELAMQVLDDRPDPAPAVRVPTPPAPESTGPLPVLARALADQLGLVVSGVRGAPGAVAGAGIASVSHPLRTAARIADLASSVGRMLAPVAASPTGLIRARSLARRFHTIDIPLADLKEAGHAAPATLNAAFMAAVVEGMRRYHERHGEPVDELRVTMPINLRHEGDDLGGNHFVPARFVVPVGGADPRQRMVAIGALAKAWQEEPALAYTELLAGALDSLPVTVTTGVFGAMLKHIDVVMTNVPGLPAEVYLVGVKVHREYAFAPTAGAAVNVSLFSFGDTACIGVVIDTAAVPDDDVLVACLVEGFDDVLSIVDHHATPTA